MSSFTDQKVERIYSTKPKKRKNYLDQQLEALDIKSIPPEMVRKKKESELLQALEKADVPFFWTASLHHLITGCAEFAVLISGALMCAAWVMILVRTFFYLASKINRFNPEAYAIVTSTIFVAFIFSTFATYLLAQVLRHLRRMKVPYWDTIDYDDYVDDQYTAVPPPIMDLVRDLQARLPGAEFKVEYLAYTSDPFLQIVYWENNKQEKRHIAQWG